MSIDIDKESGALVVSGEVISNNLDEVDFAHSSLGSGAVRAVFDNRWVIYRRIKIENGGLVFRFLDGKLAEVDLAFADMASGWGCWSEDREAFAKSLHDQWLVRHLGPPPYAFEWGDVQSVHDPKAGGSQIVVRYRRKATVSGALQG